MKSLSDPSRLQFWFKGDTLRTGSCAFLHNKSDIWRRQGHQGHSKAVDCFSAAPLPLCATLHYAPASPYPRCLLLRVFRPSKRTDWAVSPVRESPLTNTWTSGAYKQWHIRGYLSVRTSPERTAHDTGTRQTRRSFGGIGRRGAKCPAERLRLLRLGGNMRSWVLLLLSAALLRLGNAEVRLKDVQTDVMTSEFELNAPG